MEQDKADLCQLLGMCGAAFSTEDVSLLHSKVFQCPPNTDETIAAMQKIAGRDRSWSCIGENVLDVLVEMEKERDKKEKLHWDLQLLNAGNLHTLCQTDYPDVIDPPTLNYLNRSPELSATVDMDSLQSERLVRKKEPNAEARGMKRLKKSARRSWARLASEGFQSLLLYSQSQGKNLGVKSQAWGYITLSEILLLVGLKYDVVTQLLYKEMLQEHYTMNVWDSMLPWQQHEEEERLEALAEEALESGDMISLAELPGAFRIYSVCLATSLRSYREQSWSAVSLLYELHTRRQQESDKLEVLGERLDRKSLTLLSLYIRLATLRTQREKISYNALLAAQQSWETWPHVRSQCGVEQASMWLYDKKEEQERGIISMSTEQAVLQLLVLTQEKEREHLVKLVQGVSLEDLQEPVRRIHQKDDCHNQAALRNSCIKRLKQINLSLWMHSDTQLQLQADISGKPVKWFQQQLEDCSLVLLTHLIELQEAQVSVILPALMESAQCVQALREDLEFQLQAQRYTNLPILLSTSDRNVIDKSNNEQIASQPFNNKQITSQNRGLEDLLTDSLRSAGAELNEVQNENGIDEQDTYTDCGAVMEDVPYLEILCVSDSTSNTFQNQEAAQVEESSAIKSNHDYEKQGSLIALAWSRPPEDDADYEAQPAGQSKDAESSLEMQITNYVTSGVGEHTERDETSTDQKPTGDPEAYMEEKQCSTITELTLEGRTIEDQPEKSDIVSVCDLPPHALHEAETLQDEQHLLVDPPEIKHNADDLSSGLTNEANDVDRGLHEVEMGPTTSESELWSLREPELSFTEDQNFNSLPTVSLQSCICVEQCTDNLLFSDVKEDRSPAERESTLREREQAGEAVSVLERERTMRNLVDMQRKVEQRQQRDRERQLLRVQERLSIIQSRKAEEDLLGLKNTDRLRHLTEDLPQEDKDQQKTLVKERLEQLRRERSYVMQSKRDRNTAGFNELLGPVALQSRETEDGAD